MPRFDLVFSRDEIAENIPYQLVCTVRFSSMWETGRRRRLWKELFTPEERNACTRLFRQAHLWYLTRGVPDEVRMCLSTYKLWAKLGEFCAAL